MRTVLSFAVVVVVGMDLCQPVVVWMFVVVVVTVAVADARRRLAFNGAGCVATIFEVASQPKPIASLDAALGISWEATNGNNRAGAPDITQDAHGGVLLALCRLLQRQTTVIPPPGLGHHAGLLGKVPFQ